MTKKQIENRIKKIDDLFENLSKEVDKMDKHLISEFISATMNVFYNPACEDLQESIDKREKLWDRMNKIEKEKALKMLNFENL